MKLAIALDRMFDVVAPYFEGRVGHAETVAALYGVDAARSPEVALDAERIAIYARFCRIHRHEVVALYRETRAAVIALAGEAAWERLVEDFFLAHPMRSFELNENGAALPAWLAEVTASRGLPAWLPELADLEWWTWRVEVAPDEATDPRSGALRIASTVELRRYTHDLLSFADHDHDEDGPRPAAPAPADRFVLFWRDRDLDERRAPAVRDELLVLKMVSEGIAPEAMAAASDLPQSAIDDTLRDLHQAGILDGTLDDSPA